MVEVSEKSTGKMAHYKLTSTVMLWLQTGMSASGGTMNLGGSMTRQVPTLSNFIHSKRRGWTKILILKVEQDASLGESNTHLSNIGKMVEEMENKIRSSIDQVYFGKTKQVMKVN